MSGRIHGIFRGGLTPCAMDLLMHNPPEKPAPAGLLWLAWCLWLAGGVAHFHHKGGMAALQMPGNPTGVLQSLAWLTVSIVLLAFAMRRSVVPLLNRPGPDQVDMKQSPTGKPPVT